jgi:GNAT superfamily N-acetyltransferase
VIGPDSVPRPLRPDDRDRLVRMFSRLSRETIRRRFFTALPKLDGPLLDLLMNVDHDRSEALVFVVGDEIIAMASYHRRAGDPELADLAVLVEDGWQHHGLGERLMRRIVRIAQQRGVRRFWADVLPDNQPAIGLIHHMDDAARGRYTSGELSYELAPPEAAARMVTSAPSSTVSASAALSSPM